MCQRDTCLPKSKRTARTLLTTMLAMLTDEQREQALRLLEPDRPVPQADRGVPDESPAKDGQ
jgi:hypothetical protein